MSFERIFQHYTGPVPLKDISFTDFKVIQDTKKNEPVILWLKEEDSNLWYRIFIDGVYCGIDKYENENYKIDLDEDISVVDYTDKIKNRRLKKAFLSQKDKEKEILLTLEFNDDSKVILCSNYDGDCKLSFNV